MIVSFPRSGRGYVRACMYELGHTLGFTETQEDNGKDVLQTHDFSLSLEFPTRRKIVLVRDPLHCFASWYELDRGNGSRRSWGSSLEAWVPYWKGFFRRHIEHGGEDLMWFEQFTRGQGLLGGYLSAAGVEAHPPRDIRRFEFHKQLPNVAGRLGEEYEKFKEMTP